MSLLSMDAGSMAAFWSLNPEANAAHPFKISGETVLDVKEVDGKVHFDLGRIDVISDPSDMYVFAKDDNFILREDLEK